MLTTHHTSIHARWTYILHEKWNSQNTSLFSPLHVGHGKLPVPLHEGQIERPDP